MYEEKDGLHSVLLLSVFVPSLRNTASYIRTDQKCALYLKTWTYKRLHGKEG
jgi:hypothetical protein